MTQEEQIQKILELEEKIRAKQVSKLSAHTLVPLGLLLGIGSSIFFFGVTFQRLETAEKNITELKSSFKEELLSVRAELKNISDSIADLRVLLVQRQENRSGN